jgi:hypothetical protein
LRERGDCHEDGSLRLIDHSAPWIRLKRFWRDTKSTGVKDVELVVRPYKTRTAFTNLSSSPPTIYLNEYLIDDEEVVEYLILRELMHIKLNMYRSSYRLVLSGEV